MIARALTYTSMLILLLIHSCQLPYVAEVEDRIGLLSVEGSIVKGDSLQRIKLSRSTSISSPRYNAVGGCVVYVEDELGNVYNFKEKTEGLYTCLIPDEDLVYGRSYKIYIETPVGEQYESEYETLNRGAPVDLVYYEIDSVYDPDFDVNTLGAQFYLDLVGRESDSRYYRWNLTETWEYHSASGINAIQNQEDGEELEIENPYQYYFCWKTRGIPGLYSSSTVNLTSNQKKKIPLHFVSSQTDRLRIRYSLLIKQYSLNEGAFTYWNRTQIETAQLGGLHTQQPGQIRSNLANINDESEQVLGYFWVASKSEKRVFFNRPSGLNVHKRNCEWQLLEDILYKRYPLYIIYQFGAQDTTKYTSEPECLDCRLHGGSIVEPDFWE